MADDRAPRGMFVGFTLLFLAVHASKHPINDVICGAVGFQVNNLTARDWVFEVPKLNCLPLRPNSTVPDDGCKISMAFCRALPGNNSDAAVLASYSTDNSTLKLATIDQNNQPFNTTGEGFHMNYKPGEDYLTSQNASCKLQTVMTFICNSTVSWSLKDPGIQTVPVLPSIHLDKDKCVCNFTFQFAGACPTIVPSPQVALLSAGSVLLLIFFVSMICYFVLGSFVNIARGKTGTEIVPHHTFWTMLPVYIMEGIQFTLSCGGRQAGKTYESI